MELFLHQMQLIFGQHEQRLNQLTDAAKDIQNLYFNSGVYNFWGSDSEESYKNLCKTLPKNNSWHKWRNVPLKYTLNSQHYRTNEWDAIDWNNSVLLFGCSQIFGTGLDDSQTVSANLSKLLNLNVVNLGVPAGSTMVQWLNTTILVQNNIRPLASVYVWPFPERVTVLSENNRVIHSGPWNNKKEPLFDGWNHHKSHAVEFLKFLMLSTNQQWNSFSRPVFHFTFSNISREKINFIDYLDPKIDLARDMAHIGPECSKKWADTIFYKIKNTIKY